MVDMTNNKTNEIPTYEIMRHNGQCYFGGWEVIEHLQRDCYDADDGSGEGTIDVAGNEWAFRAKAGR